MYESFFCYLRGEMRRGVGPDQLRDMGYPVAADGTFEPIDLDTVGRIRQILNATEIFSPPRRILPEERAVGLAAIRGIRQQLESKVPA